MNLYGRLTRLMTAAVRLLRCPRGMRRPTCQVGEHTWKLRNEPDGHWQFVVCTKCGKKQYVW